MSVADLVRMAQDSFGHFDHPGPFDGRAPLPPWLPTPALRPREGRRTSVTQEAMLEPGMMVQLGDLDELTIEGRDTLTRVPTPSGVEDHGLDVLAYYLPFHFSRDNWGVYILLSGLLFVAQVLKGRRLTADDTLALRAGFDVLFAHERCHHDCELAASVGELASLQERYRQYFVDSTAGSVEEAFCNAGAFSTLNSSRSFRTLSSKGPKSQIRTTFRSNLKAWLDAQPGGYGQYARYLGYTKARTAKQEMGLAMLNAGRRAALSRSGRSMASAESGAWAASRASAESSARRSATSAPWHVLWPPADARRQKQLPRYLVIDVAVRGLRIVRPFPKLNGMQVLVHSNDHPPVHFHLQMPPGREYGRYTWPDIQPVQKDPKLSARDRKRLHTYLTQYEEEIRQRLEQCYRVQLGPLRVSSREHR